MCSALFFSMMQTATLKDVITKQREFLDSMSLGTPREKLKQVKVQEGFALIITGIRRCGKSTLLNQLLKKYKRGYYLNFEDPRLADFEFSDFNKVEPTMKELFGDNGVYFFDEVQNVHGWERFVRYLVDRKERVVLTGSNASLLSPELGTKLTGRHLRVEMFPFSYKEFLDMKKEKPSVHSFETYLMKGGFPEYLKREEPPILHELLSDVVMRDIAVRFGIKNTDILHRIAIYLISHVGKEFSYNSIKNMFKIKSVQSVIDYVSYFENAYLLFTIPRFSYSYKKQQVNPKKVYSIDNGFSYNNSASFSKDNGKMLENMVFLGLRRTFKDIFYFQEDNECDFVIKEREKVTKAVQVCFDFNEENQKREMQGLLTALNQFTLKEGLILTYNQEDTFVINKKKIVVKPVWKWLCQTKFP
jgi:uncharacterized protein